MNSVVREALSEAMQDRSPSGLVFDPSHNGVNEYSLKWGFEEACKRAEIVYGETKRGGIIWTICVVPLRRVFGQTEYTSMTFKICWATPSLESRRSMLALRCRF